MEAGENEQTIQSGNSNLEPFSSARKWEDWVSFLTILFFPVSSDFSAEFAVIPHGSVTLLVHVYHENRERGSEKLSC